MKYRDRSVSIPQYLDDQIERRLPLVTLNRDEFWAKLLEAGIMGFDFEMDERKKAEAAKKAEPQMVALVEKMPENVGEIAKQLDAMKTGKPMPVYAG